MHPTVFPKLGALLRLLQVTLGQPGRAHHNLTHGIAIVGRLVTFCIDDSHVDHGHRDARLDPRGHLFVHR
ncbi:hypothetical protein D3C72_2311170 [compost metagenome]